MVKNLSENVSNTVKGQVKTLNDTTLPRIRQFLKKIEEEVDWIGLEFGDILTGEYDDLFADEYVKSLCDLTKTLNVNLAEMYTELHKYINDLD